MRAIVYTFLFVLSCISVAQIQKPIQWEVSLSKNSEVKPEQELMIYFTVKIEKDWYLYSTDFDRNLGPMVTTFEFKENETYELVGDIIPGKERKKKYDSIWMGEYTYFKKQALFIQKIKLLKKNYQIEGSYSYQVCTDVDGKCIPFKDDFRLIATGSSSVGKKTNAVKDQKGSQKDNATNTIMGDAFESPPDSSGSLSTKKTSSFSYYDIEDYSSEQESSEGLIGFMILSFLAGLSALLTPCVFPMIPLTVSYFTSNVSKNKIFQTTFYGFSIVLIYALIGFILAPFMGPETANQMATSWFFNMLFFIVFFIFALSFFGLFDITLPSSLINKINKMGNMSGLLGVFFMALTLVVVSFSCTGPIVGSILVGATGGVSIKPVLGMLAFSLAFAFPFVIFSMFPGWLQNLPKSGGWLNTVKIVLGFLELAFSLKFLSVADQAYHWELLSREVYLAIWIVIFSLMGFFLLGKLSFESQTPTKVTVPRLMLSIVTFSFVLYMLPGLFGVPLKFLSGYLPPEHNINFSFLSTGSRKIIHTSPSLCDEPKYADFLTIPHQLEGYFDYEQAFECAKKMNKPVFVDFTGHGCVNCRRMEEIVWSDPRVLKTLAEKYVILSLYVDDKTLLPKKNWLVSKYDHKTKKTVGEVNADIQITKFNNNAQPFYLIMSPDEKILSKPMAYDSKVKNFLSFLTTGLKNHLKSSNL